MKESEIIKIPRDVWSFALGIISTVDRDVQNELNKVVMETNHD